MKGGFYEKCFDPVSSFKHYTVSKGKDHPQNIPPEIFSRPTR